jgi:hypothetical protein
MDDRRKQLASEIYAFVRTQGQTNPTLTLNDIVNAVEDVLLFLCS